MTLRLATLGVMITLAIAFGWLVTPARLFVGIQPMLVIASIMAAAILVRLNRAMPTLDWKSLEPDGRKRLTRRVVELNREYLSILAVQAFLALTLVTTAMTGRAALQTMPNWGTALVSALIGSLTGLAFVRMAYVAWRDYDIVKLQKELIDAAGDKDFEDAQLKAAADVVADIKSAGPRRFEQKAPSDWTERRG